jgi:hypothetical protein
MKVFVELAFADHLLKNFCGQFTVHLLGV